MRVYIAILVLLLFLPRVCAAYNTYHPYYQSVNKSTGLPCNEVYDMCEDDDGFMWLATGNGLYRYDGFSFVQWQSELQTSASGSCVRKDRFGRIWYENFDGFLYYTEGKVLKPLGQKYAKAYMPFGVTYKYLYVLQPEGVDIFDIKTLVKVNTVHLNLGRLEHATCANGAYYIAADGVIHKIDSNLRLSSFILPDRDKIPVHQLFSIADSLYIVPRQGGANTMTVLDDELRLIRKVPINSLGYVRGIEKIGTDTWLYTSLGCSVNVLGKDNIAREFFAGKSISKIVRDKSGNHWFATTNEGIYIVPDLKSKVYTYGTTKMRQVAVTSRGVLAGTYTGEILRLASENNNVTVLSRDRHGAEVYYLYADEQHIIYSATGHAILSGTANREIEMADLAIKSVVPIDTKYYAVAASGTCLLMPRPSTIYSSTSVWDNAVGINKFQGIAGALNLLDGVRGRSVAYDSITCTIYFATNSGIVAVDTNGKRQLNYNDRPVYAAELVAYDGCIYVVDAKGRILRINRQGRIEEPGNFLQAGNARLLKVGGGKLYYCAGRRLFRFDGRAAQPMNTQVDAEEINDFAVTDSCIWLATDAGIISLVNDDDPSGVHIPRFYINAIEVNGAETDSNRMRELSFAENNISINYSLVEFAVPVPSTITYRVNNDKWKELPANTRTLQFRSLSSGDYVIQFAVNGNRIDRTVAFHISRPFWQQMWFYVFGVLMVLFILLVYYSYRMKIKMRKVEAQKEKLHLEERLSRSMLTALRSQMNPHFFFNALNTVQAYIFTNERAKASEYLSKLSMLTRTILEMSETETVMLNDEIEALNLYLELERTRFGADFKYEIVVDEHIEPKVIEIPSMILQPFVENAVKHGLLHKEGEKLLRITVNKEVDGLQITVDDNGIGRSRSEALNEIKNRRHRSYATRATAERVKLLNMGNVNKIFVNVVDKVSNEGNALGTTVIIKIILT